MGRFIPNVDLRKINKLFMRHIILFSADYRPSDLWRMMIFAQARSHSFLRPLASQRRPRSPQLSLTSRSCHTLLHLFPFHLGHHLLHHGYPFHRPDHYHSSCYHTPVPLNRTPTACFGFPKTVLHARDCHILPCLVLDRDLVSKNLVLDEQSLMAGRKMEVGVCYSPLAKQGSCRGPP